MIILSCISVLSASAIPVSAQVGTEAYDGWRTVTYRLKEFVREGNTSEATMKFNFSYSDKMFDIDARSDHPDPSIAKASVALSMNAYFSETLVTETLNEMGYSVVASRNYGRESTYLDCDFVAFAVGSREIILNGENYIVYCVPVRGTSGREWYSDFDLGKDGNHSGFYAAAEEVSGVLKAVMDSDHYDKYHRIIWMTGHSRGAAVANIVAGELTDERFYAEPEHIFGYNFACPAVSRNDDVKLTDFHNIFNFNNIGDLVPLLPLADWGYDTYGQNLYLDVSQIDNLRFQLQRQSEHEYAAPLNQDGYQEGLKLIGGTEEEFNDKEMDVILFIAASFLCGDLARNADLQKYEAFIRSCFEKLGKDLSTDTIGTLLAISDFFAQTNPEMIKIKALITFLELGLETLDGYLSLDDAEEKIAQWFAGDYNQAQLGQVQKYLQLIAMPAIITIPLMKEALDCLKTVIGDYEKNAKRMAGVFGLIYSSDGKILDAFTDGHHGETYVTWINSMYLGYNGWREYTGSLTPKAENIRSVDDYCFKDIQMDVNPKYYNSDPVQLQYFGSQSFYNTGMTDLTLYKETDYIGPEAFADNVSLTQVTLPIDMLYTRTADGGVISPFAGCTNIETLIYTPGYTGIMNPMSTSDNINEGEQRYSGKLENIARNSLKSITYQEGVKELSNYAARAYYRTTGSHTSAPIELETISLPESLEKIGSFAFKGTNPKEYYLGPNLKEIGKQAFADVTSLIVGSPDSLETVGERAFSNSSITSEVLKLPGNVKTVEMRGFENCTGLSGTLEVLADQTLKSGAFYGCTGIKKVIIPVDMIYTHTSDVTFENYGPIFGECAIEEIEYKPGVTGIMPVIDDRTAKEDTHNINKNRIEFTNRNTLKKIAYDEGVISIAAYAAYDNRYKDTAYTLTLEEIVLPTTLKSVGEKAFYDLTETAFTSSDPVYPDTVDANAFYNCDGLTADVMPLPGNITVFRENAFYDCDNLMEEIVLSGEEVFENLCFNSIDRLKKVTLPIDMLYTRTADGGVISPFAGCTNIESLIYTPGYTGIMNPMSTGDNINEREQRYSGKLENIARNSLKSITYQEGVKELSNYAARAYYRTTGSHTSAPIELETISLPESLEKIGSFAFKGTNPKEYYLGPNLKEIGKQAFADVTSPIVGSPDSLETVGERAFSNSSITSEVLKLPGNVKTVEMRGFENCTGLSGTLEVLADQTLKSGAFYGCTGIKKVIIPVDMIYTHTSDVTFDNYGPIFGECAIEEIEYKPGITGIMPVIDDRTAKEDTHNINKNRIEFTNRNTLKKIVYDEGVISIAAYAAYDNRYKDTAYTLTLEEIVLPATLEEIGAYAFSKTGITSAYLLRNVSSIGEKAFDNNPDLILYVYRNTYAHQYAIDNKKNYVLLDPAASAITLPSEMELTLGNTEQLNVIYTPVDATDPLFWTSSDESIVSIDEDGVIQAVSTGTAVITAATETGLTAQTVITVTSQGVSIYGSSLALEGQIGINFYLDIVEEEQAYLNVVMTMNGSMVSIPVTDGTIKTVSGKTYRMFEYPVAAKEMRDKVTLTVEDAEGNPVKLIKSEEDYTNGYQYSATDYFARAEEAGAEKTKKLSRVLNNYGKYAQIYFGYHVTDEVLNTTDVSQVTKETLAPYQAVQTSTEVAGLTYVGGSTMLDDMIGYRLYFKVGTDYKIESYTFTIDGKKVTPIKSGSQYFIEKTDIAARDLGSKNTIEVTDGKTTFGIQYCALSYAHKALELTGEDRIPLQNMCRAMYLYNQQAIEYFKS